MEGSLEAPSQNPLKREVQRGVMTSTGRFGFRGGMPLILQDQDPQGLLNGPLDGPLRPARAVEPPVQVALSQTPEAKVKGVSTRP